MEGKSGFPVSKGGSSASKEGGTACPDEVGNRRRSTADVEHGGLGRSPKKIGGVLLKKLFVFIYLF